MPTQDFVNRQVRELNSELNDLGQYIKWVELKKPDDIIGQYLLRYLKLRRDTIELKLARYKVKMGWS